MDKESLSFHPSYQSAKSALLHIAVTGRPGIKRYLLHLYSTIAIRNYRWSLAAVLSLSTSGKKEHGKKGT
jgi:hypothetical protein